MNQAVEFATRATPHANRWVQAAQDVMTGFMSTSRLLVTFVGCATLLMGAFVASNETARARISAQMPALLAGWIAPIGAVADSGTAAQEGPGDVRAAPVSAEPAQKNITRYLSRRYRVADEAVRVLVTAAYQAGDEHAVDPMLILAVMAVESSMNPFAESAVGAQGLMQVMTRVHAEKFEPHGGDLAALDPVANIKVGSAILKDLIRRGGSVERGLQLYVGAGNQPDDGGYGSRVLAERARIELAAAGKVDLALAAGMRADAARLDMRPVSLAPAPSAAGAAPSTKTVDAQPKA